QTAMAMRTNTMVIRSTPWQSRVHDVCLGWLAPAARPRGTTMTGETSQPAIATFLILAGFGTFLYCVPQIMIAVGAISPVLGAVVSGLVLVAPFLLFWLRSRRQNGNS